MTDTAFQNSEFFVAGGTLGPNTPSYVDRPADEQLFQVARAGEFCYVLATRQMGKSSLMTRTALRLQEHGIRVVKIDLTEIGATDVTADQWYLGILTFLKRKLRLPIDLEAWWAEHATLSIVQRFTTFLRDVVLTEVEAPVVIFIDEIDTTLKLDFTADDFFAAIRATYNARADDPAFNRLTFVLLGVATPSDLIRDPARTPFNVGQGIDLREFSREDAQVLHEGLEQGHPEQGALIFDRIFYWTNGHPYLTQKLCKSVAEATDGQWIDPRVDGLVERLFLSEEATRQEDNLQFIHANIHKSPQRSQLLALYYKVYKGKQIPEDERSLVQNYLKLYGLVRAEKGHLHVRNEIYRQAFNLDWIRANTPVNWYRHMAIIATLVALVLASVLGLFIWQGGQQAVQTQVNSFSNTTNPILRLNSLANLYDLGAGDRARPLFDALPLQEKIAIFEEATPDLQPQVRTVIEGTYTFLGNTGDDTRLLEAMQSALEGSEEADSVNLANEIVQWLVGRAAAAEGRYSEAVIAYNAAIGLNGNNPGTRFERALALAALEDYDGALNDLETALNLNETWEERVLQEVEGNRQLYDALWAGGKVRPTLVALVPAPTITPILPTFTSTLIPPTDVSSPTASLPHTKTPTKAPVTTPPPTASPTDTPPPPPSSPPLVIYVQSGGQTHNLGTVRSSGAKIRNSISLELAAAPAWSPNGKEVAFFGEPGIGAENPDFTQGEGIWTIGYPPGKPVQLYAIDHVKSIAWSPLGTQLAFETKPPGQQAEIMIIDARDGRELSRFYGEQPAWSPAGNKLVIRVDPAGKGPGLWQVALDGNPEKRITDHSTDSYPALSPDGQYLAFSSEQAGNWDIYVLQLPNGDPQPLTAQQGIDTTPVFSRDSQKIYYRSNSFRPDWQILVMGLDGSDKLSVVNDIGPSDDWGLTRPAVY